MRHNRNHTRRRVYTATAKLNTNGLERVYAGEGRNGWAHADGSFYAAMGVRTKLSRTVLHRMLWDRWTGATEYPREHRFTAVLAIASWRNDPTIG